MLVNLRKVAGTWVMGIFSFLIIVSFAVWGIGDIFRGRTKNVVATVGDVEIGGQDLTREYRREIERLSNLTGRAIDSEEARRLNVAQRALDAIVSRTLYNLEGQRLGLAIGDDLLRRTIARTPAFQLTPGVFDPGLFASTLASSGLSEQRYITLLRNDLRRAQLVDSLTGPVVAPRFAAEAIYRFREERRTADFFVVEIASVGAVEEPDEAALAEFHKKNAPRYTAPEYRALTYIAITAEDLVDEIAVSDEELKAEYDDQRDALTVPEKRTIEQILLPTKEAAEAARKRLVEGGDFLAVAKEAAGMSADAVKLGTLARDELAGMIDQSAADDVFGLAAGETSAPVKSAFGWHIFRVTEIEPARTPTLDELRAKLTRAVALRKADDALYRLTNRLDDELGGGATLEEAAQRLDLPLGRVEGVSAAGAGPDGRQVEGLPRAPEFLSTAFSLASGDTSLVTEAKDGGYFVVRVDGVTPETLRPLAEVRDQVAADWRTARRGEIARERAAEAAKRINEGVEIAAIADEMGAELLASAAMRRDGNGAGRAFSPLVISDLFALDVGKAASGPTSTGEGYVVARLSNVIVPDPTADKEAIAKLRESLRNGIASDVTIAYRRYLETRYPVTIDEAAVALMF